MSKTDLISNKTEKELQEEVLEHKEALRSFRFGMAGSRTKDVLHGRNLRKKIARILTELRARELSEKQGA